MKSRSRRLQLLLMAGALWLPLAGAQADEAQAPPRERAEEREEKTWREGELRGQRGAGRVRGGNRAGFEERSALDGVVDGILGVRERAGSDR